MFTLGKKTPGRKTAQSSGLATPLHAAPVGTSSLSLVGELPSEFTDQLKSAKADQFAKLWPTARVFSEAGLVGATLGRSLFVWQPSSPRQASKVDLPCDDDHDEFDSDVPPRLAAASMACIAPGGAALAVSPAGRVRAWVDFEAMRLPIAEGTSAELRNAVDVVAVPGQRGPGFVVHTAAGTATFVAVAEQTGTLMTAPLRAPRGSSGSFLSSWLPWGGGGLGEDDRIRAVRSGKRSGDVFAITDRTMHRWAVSLDRKIRLACSAALDEPVRSFLSRVAAERVTAAIRLVDLVVADSTTVFILAESRSLTVPEGRDPLTKYHVVKVVGVDGDSPVVTSVIDVLYAPRTEQTKGVLPSLVVTNGCALAHVIGPNLAIPVRILDVAEHLDQFSAPPEFFGFGVINDSLAFVTERGVFVSGPVPAPHLDRDEPLRKRLATDVSAPAASSSSSAQRQALSVQGPLDSPETQKEQLVRAFREFRASNRSAVAALIPPLLAIDGSQLGAAAFETSTTLANSRSVTDPLRADDSGTASRGASLLLRRHIEMKKSQHESFLAFLNAPIVQRSLWESIAKEFQLAIVGNAEKLAAAASLRAVHCQIEEARPSDTNVLAHAIRSCLKTSDDAFYLEVTGIERILKYLPDLVSQRGKDIKDKNYSEAVADSTRAFLAILGKLSDATLLGCGPEIFQAIEKQWERTDEFIDIVRRLRPDPSRFDLLQTCDSLLQDLSGLIEHILRAERLAFSVRPSEQGAHAFKKLCTRFIAPLLSHGALQLAQRLAEKFDDWDTLIALCEKTGDEALLQSFMTAKEPFQQAVFQHWVSTPALQSKLLAQAPARDEAVAMFLEKFPRLAWIHDLRRRRYSRAALTLRSLAREKGQPRTSRQELASLCKLAAIQALSDPMSQAEAELLRCKNEASFWLFCLELEESLRTPGDAAMEPDQLIDALIRQHAPTNLFSALEVALAAKDVVGEGESVRLQERVWFGALAGVDWPGLAEKSSEWSIDNIVKECEFVQLAQHFASISQRQRQDHRPMTKHMVSASLARYREEKKEAMTSAVEDILRLLEAFACAPSSDVSMEFAH